MTAERQRDIAGQLDLGLVVLDDTGRIRLWNPWMARLSGVAPEAARDRTLDEVFGGRPAPRLATAVHAALEQGAAAFLSHSLNRRILPLDRDGAPVEHNVHVKPLADDGNGRACLLEVWDVSAVVRREDFLRQQARDLEAAKEQAEQASAAKTRFLAAASHDLRQPLQALSIYADVLGESITEPEARSVLSLLNGSLETLTSLLNALLDISKFDAGLVQPMAKDFPVQDLLQGLAGDAGPVAGARGLVLRVVPSRLVVHGDPILLRRLVGNLVNNAIKYTVRGRILVGCRRDGAHLRLQVWDSGIGIPADKLERIFEEFYQVDNPARDRRQGLGLGLAIVDRLARLMGCPIRVWSRPERGSMFEVRVPLGEGSPEPGAAPAAPSLPMTAGLVVVIDDEPALLEALSRAMTAWGQEVVAVPSAEAAALLLHGRVPDLILADYRLQNNRTGAEAIRYLQTETGRLVPGVLLTGDTSPERLREARESGFELLHKPVGMGDLRQVVARLMAGEGPGT